MLVVLLVFGCAFEFSLSAKILGVFLLPSYSHQIVFQPIWKELSLRGHEVTVLTPNPLLDPTLTNLTEIDTSFTYEIFRDRDLQKSISKELPYSELVRNMFKTLDVTAESFLSDKNVQELINSGKSFDVLLVEIFQPSLFALASKFSCPFIGVSSLGMFEVAHNFLGNPTHPILYPDLMDPLSAAPNLFDRIYSIYNSLWFKHFYHNEYLPSADQLARKYINDDLPYLGDIYKNFSMVLLNVNPILHAVRPNLPAVVELGNMHSRPKAELEKVGK